MREAITLKDIDEIKRVVRGHAQAPTICEDGEKYYLVAIDPEQYRVLLDLRARENWKKYYRAVRVLRGLRRDDARLFAMMSGVWWRNSMQYETGRSLPSEIRNELRKRLNRRRLP